MRLTFSKISLQASIISWYVGSVSTNGALRGEHGAFMPTNGALRRKDGEEGQKARPWQLHMIRARGLGKHLVARKIGDGPAPFTHA
jgi:hypothetical protein